VQLIAPAAPSVQATAISSSKVNPSWNSVPNATRYIVIEYIGSNWSVIGSTTTTSFIVSGLHHSTSYLFDVAAWNSAGASWGQAQRITTL
jgi:hypothetical protein